MAKKQQSGGNPYRAFILSLLANNVKPNVVKATPDPNLVGPPAPDAMLVRELDPKAPYKAGNWLARPAAARANADFLTSQLGADTDVQRQLRAREMGIPITLREDQALGTQRNARELEQIRAKIPIELQAELDRIAATGPLQTEQEAHRLRTLGPINTENAAATTFATGLASRGLGPKERVAFEQRGSPNLLEAEVTGTEGARIKAKQDLLQSNENLDMFEQNIDPRRRAITAKAKADAQKAEGEAERQRDVNYALQHQARIQPKQAEQNLAQQRLVRIGDAFYDTAFGNKVFQGPRVNPLIQMQEDVLAADAFKRGLSTRPNDSAPYVAPTTGKIADTVAPAPGAANPEMVEIVTQSGRRVRIPRSALGQLIGD